MNVRLDNRTGKGVPSRPIRALAASLLDRARRYAGAAIPSDVCIVLTNHEGIRAVNLSIFGSARETDVITQAYLPLPGVAVACGDLYVNVERAQESPRSARWSASHEFALYLAHGCDHLTGASDQTPADRRRMRKRELRWVRAAEQAGLLAHLRFAGPAKPPPHASGRRRP